MANFNLVAVVGGFSTASIPSTVAANTELHAQLEAKQASLEKGGCGDMKEESSNPVGCDLHERFEFNHAFWFSFKSSCTLLYV